MNSMESAWRFLYDEDLEKQLDPNKPENNARANARKKELKQQYDVLMRGPGKVLFEQWKKKLRSMNLGLFSLPTNELCACTSCLIIREMQSIMKLWMDAETVMKE